jgi:hypothetical protein
MSRAACGSLQSRNDIAYLAETVIPCSYLPILVRDKTVVVAGTAGQLGWLELLGFELAALSVHVRWLSVTILNLWQIGLYQVDFASCRF